MTWNSEPFYSHLAKFMVAASLDLLSISLPKPHVPPQRLSTQMEPEDLKTPLAHLTYSKLIKSASPPEQILVDFQGLPCSDQIEHQINQDRQLLTSVSEMGRDPNMNTAGYELQPVDFFLTPFHHINLTIIPALCTRTTPYCDE